jgi:hypothetical protein
MNISIVGQSFETKNIMCVYNSIHYTTSTQSALCVVVTEDENKQPKEHVLDYDGDIETIATEAGFTYWGATMTRGVSGELAVNPSYRTNDYLFRYLDKNAVFIREPETNPVLRHIQNDIIVGRSNVTALAEAFQAASRRAPRQASTAEASGAPIRQSLFASAVKKARHFLGLGDGN